MVIILPRSSVQRQEFLWLAVLTTESCGSEGALLVDRSEVFVLYTSIERVNILKNLLTYFDALFFINQNLNKILI